jgi:PAS domain S-box-containing protein
MDDKLLESERRFSELAELLPVMVFETDLQERISFVNDIGSKILGYAREEMLGQPFLRYVAPEDKARIIATSRNVMAGKFLGDNEFTLLKKKGARIATFIQSAPFKNSRGEPAGLRGIAVDISKQKKAEADLRESEKKYRTLINNVNLGIIRNTIGDEGRFLEVNKAMEEISGYSREELLSMKAVDLYINTGTKEEFYAKIAMTGETIRREIKLKKKDGVEILISALLTPIRDSQGNFLYLDSILEDITQRKRMGEILRESERRFRELADLLPVIAFEANLKGELVYVNNHALTLFGYTKDEFLGRPIFSFISPEDRERSISNSSRVLAGEYLGNNEYLAVKKDGSRFSVLIQTSPIKNLPGELTGIRGVLVDIDAQKKNEAELRESEAFSTGLFMNSPNPILVIDPESSVSKVNPAFEALTGYSSAEVTGLKQPYPWWPPEQYQRYKERGSSAGNPKGLARERYYRKKNGDIFWVVLSIREVVDKGQVEYLIMNWVDITERKRQDEQIVALYEKEKQQRETLQEEARVRGMFIDVLAHELRTPLTPILASTCMLKDLTAGKTSEIQKKLIDNIFISTETLSRRLEELLELARYSRGTFTLNIEPVDLDRYIEGVITRFKPSLIQKGQHLVREIPEKLPEADIDPSRLEQVIINLLSNASKFSQKEGTILLRVTEDTQQLQVDVKDYGIGIPLALQSRLFQPYHRVEQDRQLPGLGLGLAVSKQIVEAHGGKIWLVSQPDQGCTFSFRIPLKQAQMNG